MCGRYTLTQMGLVEERFHIDQKKIDAFDRLFNIAPSENAPVIVEAGGRRSLEPMRFGLVPSWSKTGKLDMSTVNARAESVHEKPAFREPFRHRRCLVPADGYYEWKTVGKKKIPYRITMKEGALFAFAGVWDEWKGANGTLKSFSIITTSPNVLSPDFLDRMPAILQPGDESAWLAGGGGDLRALLGPYPTERMTLTPVFTAVNSALNKGAECLSPADDPEQDLFSNLP